MIVCDRMGALSRDDDSLSTEHRELAEVTNPNKEKGDLATVIAGADVFIGVACDDIVSESMIESMNEEAIVFAMSNPTPEIMPDLARRAGARIVGTGRSDYSNQINNVLAFPGVFRGALDVNASDINDQMKLAAAYAIAEQVQDDELGDEHIIPCALDDRVSQRVAAAVAKAAVDTGVSRI